MSRIAAVLLAAGASTRFGAPKQRVLLPDILARVEASPVDEIVVVEGAYELRVESTQGRTRVVQCADWERGPGASLRCGLEALGEDVAAAVLTNQSRTDPGPLLADLVEIAVPRIGPCFDCPTPR